MQRKDDSADEREGEPLTTQFFAIIETGKEPVRVALVPLELLFIRLPPSPNCGERSRAAAAALKLIILYLRLRQSNPAVTRCSPVQTGPQQQQQGQQEHCPEEEGLTANGYFRYIFSQPNCRLLLPLWIHCCAASCGSLSGSPSHCAFLRFLWPARFARLPVRKSTTTIPALTTAITSTTSNNDNNLPTNQDTFLVCCWWGRRQSSVIYPTRNQHNDRPGHGELVRLANYEPVSRCNSQTGYRSAHPSCSRDTAG